MIFLTYCVKFLYIIGSYYISIKGISIGEGIKFFGLSLILKENSQLLRKVLERYFEFKVSSKRIIDWTEQNEHSGTIDIDDIYSIKGNNISFGYNDKNVFNNLSFSIEKGDHVLLKGENGSGKSTLSKLITGIYSGYKGEIKVNNKELKELNIDSLREFISVAPQSPFLLNLTVFENVKFYNETVPDNKINNILDKLGLYHIKDKVVGENGEFLSGGQRQKISIARAMIKNAPLTILDEPDTALDKETKDHTIDFFKESKNTVIVISHNSQWEGKFENKTIKV